VLVIPRKAGLKNMNGKKIVKVHTMLLTGENRAQTALLIMVREMRVARAQFARINSHCAKLDSGTPALPGVAIPGDLMTQEEMIECVSLLYGDVHFLLVSMSGILHLFELMRGDLKGEVEFDEINRKHKEMFEKARAFRNHLEHIDDRVKKGVGGLGDFRETLFSFDGKSFDFGHQTEKELEDFFSEVKAAHEAFRRRKGLSGDVVVRSEIKV
jgi:hypothetical protein